MARVRVSEEIWAEFRIAAGLQPINVFLGGLVEREVQRYRSSRLRAGRLDDRELLDALHQARALHDEVVAIVARLEDRLIRTEQRSLDPDSPTQSWADEI